jgi:hypothetical protein
MIVDLISRRCEGDRSLQLERSGQVHHGDIARDTARFQPAVLAALPKRAILTQSFHWPKGGRSMTLPAGTHISIEVA